MHPHTARLAETLGDPPAEAREMIVGMEHPPMAPTATESFCCTATARSRR